MNLRGKSILELKELLDERSVTTSEVYNYYVDRISTYDKKLNAFLAVVYDHASHEVQSGPLHGIPIAVKDNFCTDNLKTTAASSVLKDFIPPYESTVTRKLRDAGAVVIGKTNMDAWAHGSSTETSDFGPTKNPWDLTRAPGGSSGGSAAAVAANLAPVAIGSETAGSIRLPSSWCGIVGLKPTYGRVSRYGVIAMGSSWDCPGPMTQTVADAAQLLSVIAGHDPQDSTTSEEPVPDYVALMKADKSYTIGLCTDYFDGVEQSYAKMIKIYIDILKNKGHKVKEISLIHPKYAISVYTILQRAEVSSNLGRYDGIRYGEARSAFGEEAKRRIMLGTYTLSHGYYDAYYKTAEKIRMVIRADFERVFTDVDCIIAPTTPGSAIALGEWEKYPFFGEMSDVLAEPASAAGIPAITVPVGLDADNLPVGLQIMGRWYEEGTILNIAKQIEEEADFKKVREKLMEKYQ